MLARLSFSDSDRHPDDPMVCLRSPPAPAGLAGFIDPYMPLALSISGDLTRPGRGKARVDSGRDAILLALLSRSAEAPGRSACRPLTVDVILIRWLLEILHCTDNHPEIFFSSVSVESPWSRTTPTIHRGC